MKHSTYISLICLFVAQSLIGQNTNSLKVEGIARINAMPDELIVSADLNVKDSLYQACFNKAMSTFKALKSSFKENGVNPKLIRSKHITVNEHYEWQNNKRVKKGYQANIGLEIKDQFTQKFADALLKSLNQEHLDLNYRLAFGFSDEQMMALQQKAISLAVADAKQKAETIAKAAGIKLESIATIQYGDNAPAFKPVNLVRSYQDVTSAQESNGGQLAGVNLNPKEQQILKSINMEWRFAN